MNLLILSEIGGSSTPPARENLIPTYDPLAFNNAGLWVNTSTFWVKSVTATSFTNNGGSDQGMAIKNAIMTVGQTYDFEVVVSSITAGTWKLKQWAPVEQGVNGDIGTLTVGVNNFTLLCRHATWDLTAAIVCLTAGSGTITVDSIKMYAPIA